MSAEYQNIFDKAELFGGHLSWLNNMRQDALRQFLEQGLPSKREEDWRYTDLKALQPPSLVPAKKASLSHWCAMIPGYAVVFVNGHYSAELSDDVSVTGVEICSLSENPNLLQNSRAESRLKNLNTVFLTDGISLGASHTSAIKKLKPLHLVFLTTEPCMYHTRNIIHLKPNANVTILEEHIALTDAPYFKTNITEITLEPGAQLTHIKLQNDNTAAWHLSATHVQQQKDSQYTSQNFSLGSQLMRDDLSVQLLDKGAACQLHGLYLPNATQHMDHHTRIDHHHSHTTSDEFYKGILRDKAKGVFNGKVIVHPEAQKVVSQQQNKNLLLSPVAEINTKPELEIYADDVQCAHGATVGQLDAEALFYLRSRGIDATTATALLTEAFAQEIVAAIQQPEIFNYIHQAVMQKIL